MLPPCLLQMKQDEQNAALADQRRAQVGTGDRSERIRTYNFPQGRVTDHRINLTLYSLGKVLEGEIQELADALVTHGPDRSPQGAGVELS